MNPFNSFAQTLMFFVPVSMRMILPPQIRYAGQKSQTTKMRQQLDVINIPAGETMSYVPRHSNNNDSYTNENYIPKHSKVDVEFDVIDVDTEVQVDVVHDDEATWNRLESKVDEILATLEKDREGFLQVTKK